MSELHFYGTPESRYWILQPVFDSEKEQIEREAYLLKAMMGSDDWCILPVSVMDWNHDLAPWDAPPVRGESGFGHGAKDTLNRMMNETMPTVISQYGRKQWILCGYSLAGLFALWAAGESSIFSGIAAVSPSVWYPGWTAYAKTHLPCAVPVYLSLGQKEEMTRNPVMAAVGYAIREQEALLRAAGVLCRLDWNPGGHFNDPEGRIAKGLCWILHQLQESDQSMI